MFEEKNADINKFWYAVKSFEWVLVDLFISISFVSLCFGSSRPCYEPY